MIRSRYPVDSEEARWLNGEDPELERAEQEALRVEGLRAANALADKLPPLDEKVLRAIWAPVGGRDAREVLGEGYEEPSEEGPADLLTP